MKMSRIDISEVEGFKLGNAENRIKGTGCTVIICEDGAVGGVDVRGGAPATRETDLLRSENTVDKVNAVVLSGGSAFGLESASGVMRALADKGAGFKVGSICVPIVCAASLFDLAVGDPATFPDVGMGIDAVRNAYRGGFRGGNFGAGTGASVGKMLGPKRAMKTGLGTYAVGDNKLQVGAIAAVNACGDVYSGPGKILAGLRSEDGSTIYGTIKALKDMMYPGQEAQADKKAAADEAAPAGEAAKEPVREPADGAAKKETAKEASAESYSAAHARKSEPEAKPEKKPKKKSPEDIDIAKAIEAEYIKKTKAQIRELEGRLETERRRKLLEEAFASLPQRPAQKAEEKQTQEATSASARTEDSETSAPAPAHVDTLTAAPAKEAAPVHAATAPEPQEEIMSPEDIYLTIFDDEFEDSDKNTVSDFVIPDDMIDVRRKSGASSEPRHSSEPDDDELGYDIPFNTTIACLITNAKITKSQANKLASILHDAYARAIKPVHSTLDGDTIFVLSTCTQEVNFDAFAALATDVMQYAIIDGAVSARSAYGLPTYKDL